MINLVNLIPGLVERENRFNIMAEYNLERTTISRPEVHELTDKLSSEQNWEYIDTSNELLKIVFRYITGKFKNWGVN